jgi:hypothetical protein
MKRSLSSAAMPSNLNRSIQMLYVRSAVDRSVLPQAAVLKVLTVICVGMALGGCDPAVSIYENAEENEVYFSLHGQVGSDGGTVRVEQLRDSINVGAPPSAPETVTLRRAGTGSVDTLRRGAERVEQLRVHNYRVPPLEPGEAYRIAVEGQRGNVTSATVEVPEHRPAITVLDSLQYCRPSQPGFPERVALPVRVRVDSVERLGRVAATYTRFGVQQTGRHTIAATEINSGSLRIPVRTNPDLIDLFIKLNGPPGFEPPPPAFADRMRVTAVAVGPGWPRGELNEAQLEAYVTPRRYSNVQQGIGLVVGTHSAQAEVPVGMSSLGGLPYCP